MLLESFLRPSGYVTRPKHRSAEPLPKCESHLNSTSSPLNNVRNLNIVPNRMKSRCESSVKQLKAILFDLDQTLLDGRHFPEALKNTALK